MVKNLPAMRETPLRSLGWEDSLEKELSMHSSVLVWRIPWTEEPGRRQSTGSQRVGHDWVTNTHTQPRDGTEKFQKKASMKRLPIGYLFPVKKTTKKNGTWKDLIQPASKWLLSASAHTKYPETTLPPHHPTSPPKLPEKIPQTTLQK